MINFVCKGENNTIIKITKQYKRALDMMTELDIKVLSYNPEIYPAVKELAVGDNLNEFKIEMNKVY